MGQSLANQDRWSPYNFPQLGSEVVLFGLH